MRKQGRPGCLNEFQKIIGYELEDDYNMKNVDLDVYLADVKFGPLI